MTAPLEGVKVVELARILAGPWAGQVLADLGAAVIKVEAPEGDDTRRWGPPFIDRDGDVSAAYFHACNRGKASVVADFCDPADLAAVQRLIAGADIVIENFKVGGLAKYGLDYDSLRPANPGLIYCSITGFGQDGPYRDRAGYDYIIQGMSGLMSVTGEPDGMPQKTGVAITGTVTDVATGLPIAGAEVGEGWRPTDRTVRTDAQGRYRIVGVSRPGERRLLRARARGYAEASAWLVALASQ